MAKRKKTKKVISKNAKQLAEDMGLDSVYAVEWELRYLLSKSIIKNASLQGISTSVLAKRSGTSRARVTRILKSDTQGISIEVLLRVLAALGKTIKVSIKNEAA